MDVTEQCSYNRTLLRFRPRKLQHQLSPPKKYETQQSSKTENTTVYHRRFPTIKIYNTIKKKTLHHIKPSVVSTYRKSLKRFPQTIPHRRPPHLS